MLAGESERDTPTRSIKIQKLRQVILRLNSGIGQERLVSSCINDWVLSVYSLGLHQSNVGYCGIMFKKAGLLSSSFTSLKSKMLPSKLPQI